MSGIRSGVRRLLRLTLGGPAADADADDELRSFIDARVEYLVARGMSPEAARTEAESRLGSTVGETRDTLRRSARRRTQRLRMTERFDSLLHDLKYTIRVLRNSPGFTAAVVLTLGLGIGANVAMFSIVDRLMFRPYPYLKDPGSTHRIYLQRWNRGVLGTDPSHEYTRHLDLKRWTTSFSHYSVFTWQRLAIGVGDASTERSVALVSGTFFEFFDARPELGRFFIASEDTTPRGADVVVLGYSFWKNELASRNVIGERLQVDRISATIIGVAPEGFVGVMEDNPPAAYILATTWAGAYSGRGGYFRDYDWGWLQTMVRRKPGVSVEQASADATQAYLKSWANEQLQDAGTSPIEIAKPHAIVGPMKVGAGPTPTLEARTALWVSAVAGIVLIIACANVANLMLARALRREREIAVRLALGVSRRRLMMQFLTESIVLALLGGGAGLIVANWGGAAIRSILLSTQGAPIGVFTDWRTLGAATGIAVLAALLAGVGPSLLAAHGDVTGALKNGSRAVTSRGSRLRSTLLVMQSALSVVLLVGAGLFVLSLHRAKSIPTGYELERVLWVEPKMRTQQLDSAALVRLHEQLLARAQTLPVVEQAAVVRTAPFWSTASTGLYVTGIDSVSRLGRFTYQTSTPDYFTVIGTRILRGRGFTAADGPNAPRVAVVSEGMGRALWPGSDALGQCIRVGSDTAPCSTVVGVAEDMLQRDVTDDKRYQYYLPLDQYQPHRGQRLLLKLRGDPAQQGEEVRKALQPLMPGDAYVFVRPMREALDQAYQSWQLGATMFVGFGILALLVAAIGLYGVIGYDVAQRGHELAVRVALGARPTDIVRAVMGWGVRFAIAGIALGTLLSFAASKWIEPLLFRQSARDPLVYAGVAAVLLLSAVVASLYPATRASRADPNSVLKAA